jgi:hypothetical protein
MIDRFGPFSMTIRGAMALHCVGGKSLVSKHFRQVFGLAVALGLLAAPASAQQEQADLLLNAQPPQDASDEQLQQFDTAVLVTLVDQVVSQVQPAPPLTVDVEWLAEDFLRAGESLTYIPFSLSIDRAALGADDVALYIRAVDKNAPPTPEGEAPIYAWDSIRYPQLTADTVMRTMTLPPGDYDVFVAVKRRSLAVDGAVSPPFGLLRRDLTVTDFEAGGVTTSSVIRFSNFEQLSGPPTDEQVEANPYIFGTNAFERQFSTEYSQAGEIGFLFWVYGVETDGAGMPDVNVEFMFHRVTAGGTEEFVRMEPVDYTADNVPAGFPVADGLFVAKGAPLLSFVRGEYRLEITVSDRAGVVTSVQWVDVTVQ